MRISDWMSDVCSSDLDDYPAGMDISTARQQLGMMGGAAFDAVKTMQIDAENREAATKALVGFVIDVGLSVVPGGGTLGGLVAKDLKASYGNHPSTDESGRASCREGVSQEVKIQ